jgi:hypothetical protein
MPVEIPVTPAGERLVTVNLGPDSFMFRTYFVSGADKHWLLDIRDRQGNALISGINLVPGVDNLLKGMGNTLEGYQLHLLVHEGSEKDLEAPGNTMSLVWFNPGEKNPYAPCDPMENIGAGTW